MNRILIIVEAKHQARNGQIKVFIERIASLQAYLTSLESEESSSDRIIKQQDKTRLRKQEGILKFYCKYRVMGALCAVSWDIDVMQEAHNEGLWTCIATGSRITVNKHKDLKIP